MRKLALIFSGIVLALLVYGSVRTTQIYDVSPRFLIAALVKKLELDLPAVSQFLVPPVKYAERTLDGVLESEHPRLILPALRSWQGTGVSPLMKQRIANYESEHVVFDTSQSCARERLMSQLACWLGTGDAKKARQAIDFLLSRPSAQLDGKGGRPVDSWEWALAFDLLLLSPRMTVAEADNIRSILRGYLRAYLQVLDDESVSLWHGRSSTAAQAWILAVTIYSEVNSEDDLLLRRAQGHFQQTIEAMALTEAWPEGYNYWINSRAMLLVLAGSAYVNALQNSYNSGAVLTVLRRIGLWTIYATRPDGRIEALGDEGSRVDLKDETRRVIDLLAQTTRDAALSTYSKYLKKLHGYESYYRDYRWGFLLFNDPTVSTLPGVTSGSLRGLETYFPLAELFGAGAMNLFIARSGWAENDTFVSMRAGHSFTHHGHYDAGHFTLFKGAPLVSNSSIYNGFFLPHRLYYGIRTVAKNSLLIMRPGELVQPHPLIEKNVVDGGQRIIIPTGSRIRDVEQWRENLGAGTHFEGGELEGFQVKTRQFAYIKVDITNAYDNVRYDSQGKGGKVDSVIRELLYLFDEDRLLAHDHLVSTDGSYTKKWLLHTINKPFLPDALVFKGTESAGIMQSESDWARIENGRGRLDVKRILPEKAVIRLIGGEGYKYYVESDGLDGSERGGFNGENFSDGAEPRAWFDNSSWRIEVQPATRQKEDHFLIALSPSIGQDRSREIASLQLDSGNGAALITPAKVILYTSGFEEGHLSFRIPGEQDQLLIVGVKEGSTFKLTLDGEPQIHIADNSGVLTVNFSGKIAAGGKVTVYKQ